MISKVGGEIYKGGMAILGAGLQKRGEGGGVKPSAQYDSKSRV